MTSQLYGSPVSLAVFSFRLQIEETLSACVFWHKCARPHTGVLLAEHFMFSGTKVLFYTTANSYAL